MTYGFGYGAEVVTLGRGVLRSETTSKYFADMTSRANPLHGVVKLDIMPINIPTVFVDNLDQLLKDSGRYDAARPSLGKYYPKTNDEKESRTELKRLESELQVSLPEAIVLQKRTRWDVFKHEGLHAVFAHLSDHSKQRIVNSSPLNLIHLATLPRDNPARSRNYNEIPYIEQVSMVDEEIARILQMKGTPQYGQLMEDLPKSFVNALREEGYLV